MVHDAEQVLGLMHESIVRAFESLHPESAEQAIMHWLYKQSAWHVPAFTHESIMPGGGASQSSAAEHSTAH